MNKMHAQRLALGFSALALGAAVLTGCGGGNGPAADQASNDGYGAASSSAAAAPSSTGSGTMGTSAGTDLATADSDLGKIVVDGKGMTLYYFTKDTKGTKTSACTGECLDAWPIAVAAGDKPVVDGVSGTVGTIDAPDGSKQLTLNGMPLYYFAQDKEPGDTLGQGLNDVWYVAAPDGEMITTAPGK